MEPVFYIKNCLKELNYPRIHSMTEDEIMEIFSKTNREFLVRWFLQQLNILYVDIMDHLNGSDLAELLFSHGFCRTTEKVTFMSGECDIEIQLNILYKMFKFLKDVNASKEMDEAAVVVKDVVNWCELDTNLFPQYGAKQFLRVSEKITLEKPETCFVFDDRLDEKLISVMNNLHSNAVPFEKIMQQFMNNLSFGEKVNFDEKVLEDACTNVTKMNEFVQNLNSVFEFERKRMDPTEINFDTQSNVLMRQFIMQLDEIKRVKMDSDFKLSVLEQLL